MATISIKKGRKDPKVTAEIRNAGGDIRSLVKGKIKVIQNIRNTVAQCIKTDKPIPIFNNLMPIVTDLEVLQLAYTNLKSNKGSMTPGTTPETADSMSIERLEKISNLLKTGQFKFPAVRRTYLLKPGKKVEWNKEKLIKFGRPLGMPDFDSKIVQEAIRLTLNSIYEPIFEKSNTNFGFREGKGCHDAVRNISNLTQGMDIAIEGDIKGAFYNLDHDILIKILQQRIWDKTFLTLVYKCCKAGIFDELQNSYHDPIIGVPQGGIASPLLWNIYMNEFDKFILTDMQILFDAINKRQKRFPTNVAPNSSRYKNILYKRKTLTDKLKKLKAGREIKVLPKHKISEAIALKMDIKRQSKLLLRTPSKDKKKIRLRFYFVRYADDWILFTNAKTIVATYVKNKIESFLKYHLKLTLAIDKTKITNLKMNKAKFLGFSIFKLKTQKISMSIYGNGKRVTGNKNFIGIDKDRVLERLLWKGFRDVKDKPREQPALTTLSDYEIIMRYNSIIRGYVLYYMPIIDCPSKLNYFVHIFEYSCYKTLCHKHRTTIRKLITKYGDPITASYKDNSESIEKNITLLTAKTYKECLSDIVKNMIANLDNKTRDQELIADGLFLTHAKGFWRTKFKFQGRCLICGSKEKVHMHHIKKINGYSKIAKDGFTVIMANLNRKQVPVCKFHHDLIHTGHYDGTSISDLHDARIAQVENHLRIWHKKAS